MLWFLKGYEEVAGKVNREYLKEGADSRMKILNRAMEYIIEEGSNDNFEGFYVMLKKF